MDRCRPDVRELARVVRRVVPPGDPAMRVYETGPRGHTGRAAFAAVPDDVAEVREVLRWAYAYRVPLIPRGAGTGRAAAAVPDPSGDQGVLDLRGLDAEPEIDPVSRTVVVRAGVTLAAVDAALGAHGLTLPFAALPVPGPAPNAAAHAVSAAASPWGPPSDDPPCHPWTRPGDASAPAAMAAPGSFADRAVRLTRSASAARSVTISEIVMRSVP